MLHPIDRQKVILDKLKKDSVTSVNHLIEQTKFNESTIRRDLKSLEREKKILIVRGGVISNDNKDEKQHFIKNLNEKQKIAQHAASLIK